MISVVMKMKHRYSEKAQEIIKAVRKANKDEQVERRLIALELRAELGLFNGLIGD